MTSTTMELADVYAEAETSFWFGQEQKSVKVYTDARRSRDEAKAALEQRIKELERDAKRYRWLRECDGNDDVVLLHYYDDCDLMQGEDLDEAIDRAMSEAALTKAVEISQEYKLP